MVLANLEECFRTAILVKQCQRLHSQSHISQGILDITMFLQSENLIQKNIKKENLQKIINTRHFLFTQLNFQAFGIGLKGL